jgi:hypothetical protein
MTQRPLPVFMVCIALSFTLAACSGGGSSADVVADLADGESDLCQPACDGRECGPDGCGGYCGSCQQGYSCSGAGLCAELPTCELVSQIACDEIVNGDTSGRENQLEAYDCDGFEGTAGEIVYVFQAQMDDTITVELLPQFSNLELLVTQGPCDPDSCLGRTTDILELEVDGGKKYYIAVDGQTGEEGSFTLSVTCQSTCEPQCDFAECGDDNCGGSCGTCPGVAPECINGLCEGECEAVCDAAVCGDDGCGGSCGDCDLGESCLMGTCCLPECDGLECGDDGCGGDCGPCPAGQACDQGVCAGGGLGCVESNEPGCGGCACEACVCDLDAFCCDTSWDNLCVSECTDQCGGCEPVQGCGDGVCEAGEDEDCTTCPSDCACALGDVCVEGACCTQECDGKECGADGCGGTCGNCGAGYCWEDMCFDKGTHCLEVIPGSVNFGAVDVGAFKSSEVLIKNCGTAELSITSIEMVPGGNPGIGVDASSLPFVPIPENPLVLAADGTQALGILYLPSEPSAFVDGQLVPDMAEVSIVAAQADLETVLTVEGVAIDPDCPIAAFDVIEGSEVSPLTLLHLDGNASSSPGGDIVEYNWSVTAPDGVLHNLEDAVGADVTFKASLAGVYTFSLEVKDVAGEVSCVPAQVEVIATPYASIYVELYWSTPGDIDEVGDDLGSDLDLHVAHPWATGPDIDGDGAPDPWFNSPYDCYWMNPEPDWGALNEAGDNPELLLSDNNGGGPEVFALMTPEEKVYTVGIHYLEEGEFGPANAHIRVFIDGGMVFEYGDIELQGLDLWEAVTIDWATGEVKLVPGDNVGLKITEDYPGPS